MTELPAIKIHRADRVVVVCCRLTAPRYGEATDLMLRDDLLRLIEHIHPTHLIVNLKGVPSLASGPLSVLIEVQAEVSRRGGQLFLCGLNDHLLEKVQTLHLETVFPIYASESEAMAAAEP